MLEQIDLSKIPYFLAVAQQLNFTEAANHLYISQSSLSKAIASLEASVGFPLFTRNNRKVVLTPEGEYLYRECLKVCEQLDKAVMSAKCIREGRTGSFSVAYPGYIARTHMFQQLAAQFNIQYPNYHMDLQRNNYSEMRRILIDGKADAILYNQHDISVLHKFYVLPISTGETVLLCNPRIPIMCEGATPTVTDFKERRFVAINPDNAPAYAAQLVSCCEAYGFKPKLVRYADSIMELIDYVATSDYVTILDRTIFPMDTELKTVHIPMRERMRPPLSTVMAWREDNNNPALMQFVEIAERQLGRKATLI